MIRQGHTRIEIHLTSKLRVCPKILNH